MSRPQPWPFPPWPNPLDRPGRAPTAPDPEPAPWVSCETDATGISRN